MGYGNGMRTKIIKLLIISRLLFKSIIRKRLPQLPLRRFLPSTIEILGVGGKEREREQNEKKVGKENNDNNLIYIFSLSLKPLPHLALRTIEFSIFPNSPNISHSTTNIGVTT
jgi:hypothetical protein